MYILVYCYVQEEGRKRYRFKNENQRMKMKKKKLCFCLFFLFPNSLFIVSRIYQIYLLVCPLLSFCFDFYLFWSCSP